MAARLSALISALLLCTSTGHADPGPSVPVPRTPPLAWSSWNHFANDVNETLIRETADAIVALGLKDLGYTYVNIDAGYLLHERSADGRLQVDPQKFPSGMPALAKYVHDRGLGLGVYTDLTNRSCGIGPGSLGHYQDDADTFASWGADYLKVDYCGPQYVSIDPVIQYGHWMAFGQALKNTSRDIYYSICPHTKVPATGTAMPYLDGLAYSPPLAWTTAQRRALANSILVEYVNNLDYWYSPHAYGSNRPGGVITDIDSTLTMWNYSDSVAGTYGDFDMLQICNFGQGSTPKGEGQTLEEYRSQYSVWVVLGSPLIQSADLRSLKTDHPECLALLTNSEVLAVNQDTAMYPARLVAQTTNASEVRSDTIVEQTFARPLGDGSTVVVLLNRDESERSMFLDLHAVGVAAGHKATIRDLWVRRDLGQFQGNFTAAVGKHEVVMLQVTPL